MGRFSRRDSATCGDQDPAASTTRSGLKSPRVVRTAAIRRPAVPKPLPPLPPTEPPPQEAKQPRPRPPRALLGRRRAEPPQPVEQGGIEPRPDVERAFGVEHPA